MLCAVSNKGNSQLGESETSVTEETLEAEDGWESRIMTIGPRAALSAILCCQNNALPRRMPRMISQIPRIEFEATHWMAEANDGATNCHLLKLGMVKFDCQKVAEQNSFEWRHTRGKAGSHSKAAAKSLTRVPV